MAATTSAAMLASATCGVRGTSTTMSSTSTASSRRMVGLHLLLMVMLERLLLFGVALGLLLLRRHVGARVRLFLLHPLLLEVLGFRVVLLMHCGDLRCLLLFRVDLLLMVLRMRLLERIQLLVMLLLHGLELLGMLARDFLLLFEPMLVERLHFLIVLT